MTAPARDVAGMGTAPVTIDLALDAGTVRVHLDPVDDVPRSDSSDAERQRSAVADTVRAHIEPDPDAPPGWLRGLSGLLGFLGADRTPTTPDERAAAAVDATTLDWDADARRLVVRSPSDLSLRGVPLAVTVRVPRDSVLGCVPAPREWRSRAAPTRSPCTAPARSAWRRSPVARSCAAVPARSASRASGARCA